MIRGERYPAGFKGPHDIEKYDTNNDPMAQMGWAVVRDSGLLSSGE
jgi:hypothetical protein